jgi:sulfonate transport system substrate-binding protein
VDAWAGLDPMMAAAELDEGAQLFYRNASANTWGILNVREEFANEHPEAVARVLKVYEQARKWALKNPAEVTKALAAAAKIPEKVADKQLKERTELTHSAIGKPQHDSMLAAGLALQQAGVLPATVDVKKALDELIDTRFNASLTN